MTASLNDEVKYFHGHVGVRANRIALITTNSTIAEEWQKENDATIVDGRNKLTMPGLVNTHTHASMTLMRGLGSDLPLMEWLNAKMWPFEAVMNEEDVYWGAKLGVIEMLLSGTTTFLDMYMKARFVRRAAEETGIRSMLCSVIFDHNADSCYDEIEKLAAECLQDSSSRTRFAISPHAPYTCGKESIKQAVALAAKYNTGIHTHISETKDEVCQMKERYNTTSTLYLEQLGVFDHLTMAAHCVYLSNEDIDVFKKNNVSVLHNPQSNMKLASGIAPIARYVSEGINVSIGTDGPASNNNLCMWDELRSASFLQKVATLNSCTLPAYQTLQMATVNGAKTLGMEGEIGILKEGAFADIILIDIDKPHFYPHHDLIAHLAYSMQGSDVHSVIVDGKIVVKDRVVLTANIDETCREVNTRSLSIASKYT